MFEKIKEFRCALTSKLKFGLWRVLQLHAKVMPRVKGDEPSLLLIPCEAGSVIGSRGDEAMVYAILGDFRKRHPSGAITVICSNPALAHEPDGQRLQRDFPGLTFVSAWTGHWALVKMYNLIRRVQATEVYALGADCMDGYYDSTVSLYLLALSDLATRSGACARLTGFSFNDHPTESAVRMFDYVSPQLVCNVRDPISLGRLEKFLSRQASRATLRLVADVAFNLVPSISKSVEKIGEWVEEERKAGRIVLAFNLHGMLVEKKDYQALVDCVSKELHRFLDSYEKISLLLVPHDYRPQGDIDALTQIFEKVKCQRIRLVSEVLSAAELKGLMGFVDGLFTSRMHLAIAALGQGKPVGAFAYQGKFAGLFRHFELPEEMILDPKEVGELSVTMTRFVVGIERLTISVQERLNGVKDISRLNFAEGCL